MTHAEAMAARLPTLYREGELVEALQSVLGLQLEIVDEEAIEIQRAHWFDSTLELEEAARLAALLDIVPEPWQDLAEFRPWVHELRDARLRDGAVTRPALEGFVGGYAARYEVANEGIDAVQATPPFADTPRDDQPAFVEFPPRRKVARFPMTGGIEPLHQFRVTQRGLDAASLSYLLTGLPAGPEHVPVLANVTTGRALLYMGAIGPGQRLWLNATEDGGVQGSLEGTDVSERLRSIRGLVPGTPWTPPQIEDPARALVLVPGANDLWFLPVAHFDVGGLDRFLLALADLVLQQGRWDAGRFDHALFFQDPAVTLHLSWIERQPASFDVHLPAGRLLHRVGRFDAAHAARRELEVGLTTGVERLRAAGVATTVRFRPWSSMQAQGDRLVRVLPLTHREPGPTGADRIPDAGALFEVTDFDDSVYR